MITRFSYLECGKTKLRGDDKVPEQYLVVHLEINQHPDLQRSEKYSQELCHLSKAHKLSSSTVLPLTPSLISLTSCWKW